MINKFSRETISELKYYVYTYSDPRDGKVFYVGRGKGNRCFDHLRRTDGEWGLRLGAIRDESMEPQIDILASGLDNNAAAMIEAAVIETYGKEFLLNEVRGHGFRKRSVEDVEYVSISEFIDIKNLETNLLRISINKTYSQIDCRNALELYEITRACWSFARLPKDIMDEKVFPLALATIGAVKGERVVEVYEIACWLGAEKAYHSRGYSTKGKHCFIGNIAAAGVREKYINKLLPPRKQGEANPLKVYRKDARE